MALFEYFPNYIWNLSVAMALESGGQIGEIIDMCQPIRAAAASGADAGTPQFMRQWVAVADKLIGLADEVFARTLDYIKQRKQFGKLIGEFQSLQHRAAHLYSELEIARATVIKAQQLLDAGSEKAELMVSVAKAKAGKAAGLAVKEGVQMHGGIGMTDEYDIGLYMKRDRALAEFMGDLYYHADRVARLSGY